jgi:hypothetical protein
MPRKLVRVVSEAEFSEALRELLSKVEMTDFPGWVTGPGRSGAIAAVYTSHLLGIPFLPFGQFADEKLGRVLLIDTARETGGTLRKAARKYEARDPLVLCVYEEPPRVAFWYEAPKPQFFRHESKYKLKEANYAFGRSV